MQAWRQLYVHIFSNNYSDNRTSSCNGMQLYHKWLPKVFTEDLLFGKPTGASLHP